jgi:hypothetical protein
MGANAVGALAVTLATAQPKTARNKKTKASRKNNLYKETAPCCKDTTRFLYILKKYKDLLAKQFSL